MKYKVLLIWVCLLTAAVSCKDDTYFTTVNGKVINTGTQKGIDSVLVVLQDGVGASGSFTLIDGETSSDAVSATYTDSNGNFELSLKGEFTPYLYVSKDRHEYLKNNHVNLTGTLIPFADGNKSGVVVEMKAKAYFDPTLVSNEPVGEYDFLRITFYRFTGPTVGDSNRISHLKWDNFRDVVEEYPENFLTIGDKWLRYGITYERNKEFHHFVDSVYVPSFDTVFKTIYY
ncbi:MAG: hypothetical protein ACI81S_002068 [Sphingobacteriales bacterium]|jgi:hypothetical protein